MNRIDRLTAILIQLQSKRIVKAQEIADRFEISLRTVYRDVRALEEAGVPIVGEAGLGYSMMDGYKLPPVMFTQEEAVAFLTAEKLVEKLTDTATKTSYQSAMFKIKAVLKRTEKDYLEQLDEHILVLDSPYLSTNSNESTHLQAILQSVANRKVIEIDYFANNTQTSSTRQIEPLGVFYQHNHWYMIAYCLLRNDYRNFRLNRITHLRVISQRYSLSHPPLKDYLAHVSVERELHTVVIQLDKSIIKYLGSEKYYHGFVSQEEFDDYYELTFLTASLHGFARWYLFFAEHAHIQSPVSLLDYVKKHVEIIRERMG